MYLSVVRAICLSNHVVRSINVHRCRSDVVKDCVRRHVINMISALVPDAVGLAEVCHGTVPMSIIFSFHV